MTPAPLHRQATKTIPAAYGRAALAAGMVALGIYLLTIAPDLSWANASPDGVELITASATLGIPHPPGYPTYVVLAKLFSLLPVGTVAFRYNLFSALAVSLTVAVVVLTIGCLHRRVRPMAASVAALLFGFAPLVWSQALVAEVYPLNLLLLALFLMAGSRDDRSIWVGLWLGLAITTHPTSLFFLPLLFISGGRRAARPIMGALIGLSPLLLLPLLAAGDSPIVWGRPAELAGWWWLVSGQLYGANFRPGFDWGHAGALVRALVLGPSLMIATGNVGPFLRRTSDGEAAGQRKKIILLGLTGLLYVVFAFFYRTPDAAVLLLPALLIAALLLAPLLERGRQAVLILPILLVVFTFSARDLSGEVNVRRSAEMMLELAPANAVLLTPGDRTIFTILYFQYVEGSRLDLRVADANLFAFDWYRERLRAQYPDIFVPEADDLIAFEQQNGLERPFCWASLVLRPDAPTAPLTVEGDPSVDVPTIICRQPSP
ncbi:MAG: DUF2723 domain-containing protein [Candidatus Promineofilum sp.]|nr:DUF2723 domain-containing protein [Promineifilum sp.]